MTEDLQHIRKLALRLSNYELRTIAHISIVGQMAGALYALEKSINLGYNDTRAIPNATDFKKEFALTTKAIGLGEEPPRSWQAGYYFNSSIMRLAALNEKIGKALGNRQDITPSVRRAVNDLKHNIDAHLSGKSPVYLNDAILAATNLSELLVELISKDQIDEI